MAHSEAVWPSQQNIQNFFLFHYFVSSTCGHNFGSVVARKSSIGGFVFVQGGLGKNKTYRSVMKTLLPKEQT